jgi:hypothetical protein
LQQVHLSHTIPEEQYINISLPHIRIESSIKRRRLILAC